MKKTLGNTIRKLKSMSSRFLKDESGQSTTEYVLLLVFVVMAVKAVGNRLNTGLSRLVDSALGKAEQEIEN